MNLAEIEAIAKKRLAMLHNIEAADQSACELSDASNTTLVTVTVHWAGGKELARISHAQTKAVFLSVSKSALPQL